MFAMNFTIDIIFLVDVAKNFCTGFVDTDGFIVMDRRAIARHYAGSWFIPDLVSSVPIDAVLKALGRNSSFAGSTRLMKMVRLVRLAKLFRLLRASSLLQHVKAFTQFLEDRLQIEIGDGALGLTKLFIALLVLSHWLGCITFMVRVFLVPRFVIRTRVNQVSRTGGASL